MQISKLSTETTRLKQILDQLKDENGELKKENHHLRIKSNEDIVLMKKDFER